MEDCGWFRDQAPPYQNPKDPFQQESIPQIRNILKRNAEALDQDYHQSQSTEPEDSWGHRSSGSSMVKDRLGNFQGHDQDIDRFQREVDYGQSERTRTSRLPLPPSGYFYRQKVNPDQDAATNPSFGSGHAEILSHSSGPQITEYRKERVPPAPQISRTQRPELNPRERFYSLEDLFEMKQENKSNIIKDSVQLSAEAKLKSEVLRKRLQEEQFFSSQEKRSKGPQPTFSKVNEDQSREFDSITIREEVDTRHEKFQKQDVGPSRNELDPRHQNFQMQRRGELQSRDHYANRGEMSRREEPDQMEKLLQNREVIKGREEFDSRHQYLLDPDQSRNKLDHRHWSVQNRDVILGRDEVGPRVLQNRDIITRIDEVDHTHRLLQNHDAFARRNKLDSQSLQNRDASLDRDEVDPHHRPSLQNRDVLPSRDELEHQHWALKNRGASPSRDEIGPRALQNRDVITGRDEVDHPHRSLHNQDAFARRNKFDSQSQPLQNRDASLDRDAVEPHHWSLQNRDELDPQYLGSKNRGASLSRDELGLRHWALESQNVIPVREKHDPQHRPLQNQDLGPNRDKRRSSDRFSANLSQAQDHSGRSSNILATTSHRHPPDIDTKSNSSLESFRDLRPRENDKRSKFYVELNSRRQSGNNRDSHQTRKIEHQSPQRQLESRHQSTKVNSSSRDLRVAEHRSDAKSQQQQDDIKQLDSLHPIPISDQPVRPPGDLYRNPFFSNHQETSGFHVPPPAIPSIRDASQFEVNIHVPPPPSFQGNIIPIPPPVAPCIREDPRFKGSSIPGVEVTTSKHRSSNPTTGSSRKADTFNRTDARYKIIERRKRVGSSRDREPAKHLRRSEERGRESTRERIINCLYCDSYKHQMSMCPDFQTLDLSQRSNFVKDKGICLRCISSTHEPKYCRIKGKCSDYCDIQCHKLLHICENFSVVCFLCMSMEHRLNKCPTFTSSTKKQRIKFAKQYKACLVCLEQKHSGVLCPKRMKCSVKGCQSVNHSLIHNHTVDENQESDDSKCCLYCNSEEHRTPDCSAFQNLSLQDQTEFVKSNSICVRCVNAKHALKKCKSKNKCSDYCDIRTHKLLHTCENLLVVCYICENNDHRFVSCPKFRERNKSNRFEEAKKFNVCLVCLEDRHSEESCPKKTSCGTPHCINFYHPLVHTHDIKAFCEVCKNYSHGTKMCPNLKCVICGNKSHLSKRCKFRTVSGCPEPDETDGCKICQSKDHFKYQCFKNYCKYCKTAGHQINDCYKLSSKGINEASDNNQSNDGASMAENNGPKPSEDKNTSKSHKSLDTDEVRSDDELEIFVHQEDEI